MGGKLMTPRHLTFRVIPGVLGLALICAPALAASNSSEGETSGPAAGKTAVPNTAVEKHANSGNAAAGTGGAGVEGKSGGKSGAAPANHTAPSNNR
jgi:hypothetical protein